jgi:hypothetical protein
MDQGGDSIRDFRAMPVPTLRCPFASLRRPLFEVPATLCRPFVARAAAANVNPRTRLGHMTPLSGRDWCTRERCRLMMTPPPPTPLRPGACCTEASCVTHWILVRDPLKPRACLTEACPGELTPHHSPMDQGSDFRAMLSLSRPVLSKFRHPAFAVLCCRLFVALLWSPEPPDAPLWPARLQRTLILARG